MSKHFVILVLAACCGSLIAVELVTTQELDSTEVTPSLAAVSTSSTASSVDNNQTTLSTGLNWVTAQRTNDTVKPFKLEDARLSKICQVCQCQAVMEPLYIDCTAKDVEKSFLDSDWPLHSPVAYMDVRFDKNRLREITPFPKLPITSLSYLGNNIEVIATAAFRNLPLLEHLDLSENRLSQESLYLNVFEGAFMKDEFEPIPLKTLKVGYNLIHSLDKDVFDHIPFLEILELNNNPLEIIDHQTGVAITTLRKLKVLNLAETQLKSLPEGFLHGLRHLKVLILSGNQLVTVPEELQRSINLEFLNLNNNPIATLNADSFTGLKSLKQLNVSSMLLLENITSNTFTPLTELTSLWCSFNPMLNTIDSAAFNGIADSQVNFRLSEFHFRGNGVPSIAANLLPWHDLDIIDIEENPFICDCRAGWLITNLIPIIEDMTPELSLSLTCAGPEEYKNRSLLSLIDDKNVVRNCSDGSGGGGGGLRSPFVPASSYSVGLMVVVGVFLVVGGISCMAVMAVRKNHLRQMYDRSTGQFVHYIRTPGVEKRDADEMAIISQEYTQFNNMSEI